MVFFVDLLEWLLNWTFQTTSFSICWSRYEEFSALLKSGRYVHLATTYIWIILLVEFIRHNHVWRHKADLLTILSFVFVHYHLYHCLPVAILFITETHSQAFHFTVGWDRMVLVFSHIRYGEMIEGGSISLMIRGDGDLDFRSLWGLGLVDNRVIVYYRSLLHHFILNVNLWNVTWMLLTQICYIYVRKVPLRFWQSGHSYVPVSPWLVHSAASIRCLIILTLLDLQVIVRSQYVAQYRIFHIV